MAECKRCGARGLFLYVSSAGICGSCEAELNIVVPNLMRIIKDSAELVNKSKNWKTRLSRCDLGIEKAEELMPLEDKGILTASPSIAQILQDFKDSREEVIRSAIEKTYEDARAKAQTAATPRSQITAAKKGLLNLRQVYEEVGNHPLIPKVANRLKEYAHGLELNTYITAAQKAEFKKNYKKALDQYQEALFFLKTDDIDDSLQADIIGKLERKIRELEDVISKGAAGARGKQKQLP